MHMRTDDLPVKLDAPGATARQRTDFGDASGFGVMSGEHLVLATGTDIAPLLEGLDGDTCHAPHWGYVLRGALTVSYRDGTAETCVAGELFHWPPGHSVRVDDAAELVMFSPQTEHTAVFDHMIAKMAAAS